MATDDDDMGSAPTVADTESGVERPSSLTIPPLPTVVADRYEILGLVGAGGMGRVYRAHDRKLDETIALKLLRRELVDMPDALERFRQEVKLARRVTSPHVVRTFDLGEHGGEQFLTMEYIEGRSLAQLIEARPLPTDEVLRIARAVCAGVAAAHAVGILHRDLKPDNILIGKSGRIAITDFGIARAAAEPGAAAEGLVGTPAYMAPEQVLAKDELTPAADVYAFGAILFEMLTGRKPFVGTDAMAVAIARLHTPPPDPRDILHRDELRALQRPELVDLHDVGIRPVPDALAALVLRCLARTPSSRYPDGGALATALAEIGDVTAVDRTVPRALPIPAKTSRAVALLPLQATGDLADISDGLSEEIVDALTMTRELRVVPLSSVRALLRESREPTSLGKSLNVDVVVDGSLRRRGDRVRVSARAIGVVDGFQLWANHVDTTPEGLLDAGDQVARAIAQALTVEIELPLRIAPSARAIELYLEGKARLRAGWFDIKLRGARSHLEDAHRLAPDDAGILATLSLALARMSFVTPDTHLPRARALAERAVSIAPQSGDAWLALGFACLYASAHADATRAFTHAVRHAPGLALAQATLGGLLLEAGALDEALVHLEAATALDAAHPPLADLPRAYVYAGREADAIKILREAKSQVHFAAVQLARFAMWRGERIEIDLPEDVFASSMGDFGRYAQILSAFHRTGRFAAGEREWIEDMIAIGSPRMRATISQFMAEHMMFAGEAATALEYLKQSVSSGLQDILWMERCPLLAPLRELPEFQALAQTVASRGQAVLAAARAG